MHFEFYKNILSINNYRQIKQLNRDLIELDQMTVSGTDLEVLRLSKDCIIIRGVIKSIQIGDALYGL